MELMNAYPSACLGIFLTFVQRHVGMLRPLRQPSGDFTRSETNAKIMFFFTWSRCQILQKAASVLHLYGCSNASEWRLRAWGAGIHVAEKLNFAKYAGTRIDQLYRYNIITGHLCDHVAEIPGWVARLSAIGGCTKGQSMGASPNIRYVQLTALDLCSQKVLKCDHIILSHIENKHALNLIKRKNVAISDCSKP